MIMLLLTHIAIALGSLAIAGIGLVRPSETTLKRTYVAIVATLASGTLLTVASHSPILQSCMTGLAYLSVVTVATAVAKYRLAVERSE
jgi:hypothetical protein